MVHNGMYQTQEECKHLQTGLAAQQQLVLVSCPFCACPALPDASDALRLQSPSMVLISVP